MAMIEEAGRLNVPFTSGILIGIGESRLERLQSLLALRDVHSNHDRLRLESKFTPAAARCGSLRSVLRRWAATGTVTQSSR